MTKKPPSKEEIFGKKPQEEEVNYENIPEETLQRKWSGKGKIHDGLAPSRTETEGLGLDCSIEPSRTDQSQAPDCDINNIMKRFEQTGQLPHMIKSNPEYGDFSEPTDYQNSLNVVMKAQEQFDALNAHIRARFDNDPQKFLEFATDSRNGEELIKMGLATPRPRNELLDEMKGLREDFKARSKPGVKAGEE